MMEPTVTIVKKVYPAVDIAKFICAILVIGIHTEPVVFNFFLDKAFGVGTRLAVPFFFISSSYFLFRKRINDSNFSIKPYISRVATIYFSWSLIYLPLRICSWIDTGASLSNISFLYIKDIFVTGTYLHLWFLPSLIIGVILVGTLLEFMKIKGVLVASLIMFCVGTMLSTYLPVTEATIGNTGVLKVVIDNIGTRNGLFYAFPYVALGAWLSTLKGIVEMVSMRKWVTGLLLSMICLGIESSVAIVLLKTQETILWFSVIPATVCLFAITLKSQSIKETRATRLLRSMSILMYTSHYLFIVLFTVIFGQISNLDLYHPLLFTCVTVSSIALSICIVYASDKSRILKLLY